MKTNYYAISKKRRGLSSIVGALLFVVLMVSAFAVLGVALNSQTEIVDTGRSVAQKDLQKQQEKFTLERIQQLPTGFLQVNLTNNGQNAAEMFTIVITNKSDIGIPTKTFQIPSDTSFLAPNADEPTNIVATLDLRMDTPPATTVESYDFKVISSLGTIKKLTVECDDSGLCGPKTPTLGIGELQAQIFVDGPNGVNTKNNTVVLLIQNQGLGSIFNVSPIDDCDAMTAEPIGGSFDPCTLDSPDPVPELLPGSTAVFTWDGIVNGAIDDKFTFCNWAGGFEDPLLVTAVPNSNRPCDTMVVIDPTDCGGCGPGGGGGDPGETLIILDDLLVRPSLFLTIPSPFGTGGSADDLGLWGVNVANPTNSTMKIAKVAITAFAPGANDNVEVFDMNSGNHQTVLPPGVGLGDWEVGTGFAENVAVWYNFDNPVVLPPYSNGAFMFKSKPEDTTKAFESIIIQAAVFSTSGSFGKAGYQTTMFGSPGGAGDSPIGNIYLSNVTDSRANSSIQGDRLNIKNGTQQNFSIVYADMDNDTETAIVNGSKMIINVPRDWTNVSIIPSNTTNVYIDTTNPLPEFQEPSIKLHGDGTHQIIATLNTHLGNGTGGGANPNTATVSFTAKSPEKQFENMHIMYVLGFGQTEEFRSAGPLSEIILHVIGNVTGYP